MSTEHAQQPQQISEKTRLHEERINTLVQALQLETPNSSHIPAADAMQRDIKRLQDRLAMFPSDDYADLAREGVKGLTQALKDYHKIG